MEEKYTLSFSPHIRRKASTTRIMLDVIIALIPALVVGIYYFGVPALLVTCVSVAASVATELLIQLLTKKSITIKDLSAVVTGLLLAMTLPPTVPLYIPAIGAVFAIAICKQCFGGLGCNFINPALCARAMLMIAWPVALTTYVAPHAIDAVSSATPLAIGEALSYTPSILDLATGNIAGSLGETCKIALLIGGIYLIIRKVISFRIPLAYFGTMAALLLIFGHTADFGYQMLSGGLFLGAFFMATDYVTSPIAPWAQVVFGIGCGILTFVIRIFGGYQEGVCFAILLMNLASPLLDKAFARKIYGEVKTK